MCFLLQQKLKFKHHPVSVKNNTFHFLTPRALTGRHVWDTTCLCYSLHAASDSSDPSEHSSSPSHFHLSGMQCPLSQAKSVSAQVFFAARNEKNQTKLDVNISRMDHLHCIQPHEGQHWLPHVKRIHPTFNIASPRQNHTGIADGCSLSLKLLFLSYSKWIHSSAFPSRQWKISK